MRIFTALYLLPPALTAAFQLPNIQSFASAFAISIEDYIPSALSTNSSTAEDHELLKRQYSNTCPEDFHGCNDLGAPGLCCASAAVCSADARGNVACCPAGAECSGTIGGVITEGTVNSIGSLLSGSAGAGGGAMTTDFQSASTASTNALVHATTESAARTQTPGGYYPSTPGGGFVVDGTSTVATPGSAMKAAQIPLAARAVLRLLEYLPI